MCRGGAPAICRTGGDQAIRQLTKCTDGYCRRMSERLVVPPDQYVASLARKRMAASAFLTTRAGYCWWTRCTRTRGTCRAVRWRQRNRRTRRTAGRSWKSLNRRDHSRGRGTGGLRVRRPRRRRGSGHPAASQANRRVPGRGRSRVGGGPGERQPSGMIASPSTNTPGAASWNVSNPE
jgi:hypothetical protein